MNKKFYHATNGYHDISPGQSPLKFSVIYDDDGNMIAGVPNNQPICFNEVQVAGDPDFRRSLIPSNQDVSDILLLDDPEYDKRYLRLQTMAGKQIPMDHSDDFVARWVALSVMGLKDIQRGETPPFSCFETARGNWGGIKQLSLKRDMLKYIDGMDDETRDRLLNADSSKSFATNFINWRDGLESRMQYQSIGGEGGES